MIWKFSRRSSAPNATFSGPARPTSTPRVMSALTTDWSNARPPESNSVWLGGTFGPSEAFRLFTTAKSKRLWPKPADTS